MNQKWKSAPYSGALDEVLTEDGTCICVCDKQDGPLIAAAPELLEVALKFVEGCQNGEAVGEKFFSALYDQASALISKAHGGYTSA